MSGLFDVRASRSRWSASGQILRLSVLARRCLNDIGGWNAAAERVLFAGGGSWRAQRPNEPFNLLGLLLGFMVFVGIMAYLGKLHGGMEIAMIAIGIPRLHDIGRSGWIVAAVIGIEIVVLVGAAIAGASINALYAISGIIFFAISALGIWLGTIPGDPGANKWGDPPLPGLRFRKPQKQS